MRWRERPSPNHGPRRPGAPVDILLLHYTGMPSAAAALDRLCDPLAQVSAHWLVEEDGTLWRLVTEERRAWHAGLSHWAGERDVNSRSVGIELANPGHEWGYRPFPQAQMASLAALARGILARWPIPAWRVLGHSDVAPARKCDPGELLDWRWLAGEGVGLVPPEAPPPAAGVDAAAGLARLGYDPDGLADDPAALRRTVAAFQRHWRQGSVDGVADAETCARLAWLVDRLPPGA